MSVRTMRAEVHWRRAVRAGQRILTYVLVVTGAIFVSIPFYWLFRSSLMVEGDFYVFPPILWPNPMLWRNYVEIFDAPYIPLAQMFKNSLVLVVTSTIGELLAASMVSFALGRLRWWGRDIVFAALVATMFLPYQVTMIPLFLGFYRLGLVDTLWPMILPSWFGHAFYIFMMRQFIMRIPLELDDAMRIDGAGTFRIYWNLIVPLSRPALITIAVFSFQGKWTQFLQPMIYINETARQPLAVGVRMFRAMVSDQRADSPFGWHHAMAATVAFIIPIIVVFFLSQRSFMQGMVDSGLKG